MCSDYTSAEVCRQGTHYHLLDLPRADPPRMTEDGGGVHNFLAALFASVVQAVTETKSTIKWRKYVPGRASPIAATIKSVVQEVRDMLK